MRVEGFFASSLREAEEQDGGAGEGGRERYCLWRVAGFGCRV